MNVSGIPVRKVYFMLMVADMDRAVRFYSDTFAATVALHSPYWSEVVVAGATVALHPGRTGGDLGTGLGFEVDNLDDALRHATELGGRVTDPPRDRPREGIRIAQLADSEGNIISVAETAGLTTNQPIGPWEVGLKAVEGHEESRLPH